MPTVENQELRDAIRHISHKFRTPLNVISSSAQMLKMQPVNDKQKDYLERQLRAIDKMTNILDELLDSVGEPTRHAPQE